MDAALHSISALPGQQGFDAWREGFARKIGRVDVTTPDPKHFSADTRVRPLPGIVLSYNRIAACSMMRTRDLLCDDDDAINLSVCLEGRADIRFGDDTCVVHGGQAVVIPHYRLGGVMWKATVGNYSLRMERSVARRIAPSIDAVLLRTTPHGDPAFALLRAYCAQLVALPVALPGTIAALAGAQLEELVAHLFGHHSARDLAGGSGLRAARLAAVKNEIAANLGGRDLSASLLAARHRLTERQFQRLFESEGTTFTEYVLTQRLARVHRLLGDPRRVHEKISALAAEAGFHDLSHFNRAFRERYGDTPSGVRAAMSGTEA